MSFIVKFIQLYSSAETVKKATVDFTLDNLDIGADVFSDNGKSSRCIKDRTENKWIFYTKHILHQLKILMSITAKVYPNCEKKFHCYLKS